MSSDHASSTRIVARYGDGLTAAIQPVEVVLDDTELVIHGADFALRWSRKTIRLVAHTPGDAILLGRRKSDERLIFPAADLQALENWLPHLLAKKHRQRGTFMLAASLTGLAASLAAVFLFGVPALSGPLSRLVPLDVETRIGDQSNSMVSFFARECSHPQPVRDELDRIAAAFTTASRSEFDLTIRIVDADFPNAFAMPGGSIVVTDDLVEIMESQDEFLGVLAHEAAHVANRHVMAAQLRELGAGMVLELLVGGGTGAGQELARAGASLNGLRHSRDAEREADLHGIEYLAQLDMNPEGMAAFFDALQAYVDEMSGLDSEQAGRETDWLEALLSTHPDTPARAAYAREVARDLSWTGEAFLSVESWAAIGEVCSAEDKANDADDRDVLERLRDVVTGKGSEEH